MDSAKRCREQSAECLSGCESAPSDTEERLLRTMSQSWVRIANQIERYHQFVLQKQDTAGRKRVAASMGDPESGAGPNAR